MPFTEDQLTVLEWTSTVLNLCFTVAITYEKRAGWVLGFFASLIGVGLYLLKHTWAMSALNSYYVVMAVYGWWSWGRRGAEAAIARKPMLFHHLLVPAGLVVSWLLALVLGRYLSGAFPEMDAFITVFSFIATWMMARKLIENWLYFTVADAVGVYLNWRLGYNAYALLNIGYLLLAVVGLWRWSRAYAKQRDGVLSA